MSKRLISRLAAFEGARGTSVCSILHLDVGMNCLLFMQKTLLVIDLLVSTLADAGGEEAGSSAGAALLHGIGGALVFGLSGHAACGEGPEQVGSEGKGNGQVVESEYFGPKLHIDRVWLEGCVPGANESGEEDGGGDGSN